MNELQTVAEGDLTQEANRDRGHHRRHRRLGELHGGRTAPAGGQRAEHGYPRGADDVAGGKHLDRAAGRLDRTAARNSRNRPVGADHGRANQRRVHAGAESATVARQSLQAASSGLQAVQNAIGGMNSIRDQIQETSERIRRPGRILAGEKKKFLCVCVCVCVRHETKKKNHKKK